MQSLTSGDLGAGVIAFAAIRAPSGVAQSGFVDPALWRNRERDPISLRAEFDGLKGRAWLMKWLPARAYDNDIYAVFSIPLAWMTTSSRTAVRW